MSRIILPFLFFALLVSCQSPETKLYSKFDADYSALVEGRKKKLILNKDVIIVDARKRFDHTMLNIPGSILLSWEEFTDHRSERPGLLQDDYSRMTQRLARLGITPDTNVIVVGYGVHGRGEEGRLAWTLLYLGVKNVQVAEIHLFKKHLRQGTAQPREPVPYWKPKLLSPIRIRKAEFLELAKSARQNKVRIIDVRSEREYLKGSTAIFGMPEITAINIEWREFYNRQGRPNLDLISKLKAIGIHFGDSIVVVSNKGIRSAAVTTALLTLGYQNVKNYDGGLVEIKNY
ncbi:MAG: hypothetical protein CL677_06425 [Bdellovibrionaceae bacterium]|nr:hypothetical protein [Pseudobdellovibrionaceae bacterium]|tara:strand:+ start:26374 stop:27240 length:867 start_codon:yes stop_codon:yes gene_type:complete